MFSFHIWKEVWKNHNSVKLRISMQNKFLVLKTAIQMLYTPERSKFKIKCKYSPDSCYCQWDFHEIHPYLWDINHVYTLITKELNKELLDSPSVLVYSNGYTTRSYRSYRWHDGQHSMLKFKNFALGSIILTIK